MRRFGVILLILFEAAWLNAFLPGHTRGVVTVGKDSCCQKDHSSSAPAEPQKNSDQRAKQCAVCFFAARLTVSAPLVIDLAPLAQVDEAPVPPPPAIVALEPIGLIDSRGPPTA